MEFLYIAATCILLAYTPQMAAICERIGDRLREREGR